MKNNLAIKEVNFQGIQLLAVQQKETGRIYTGINIVLSGLGFDEYQVRYQREKWNEDKVVSKGVRKFSHPSGKGGVQETYCIDIKKLPLALAKINITPKMEAQMPELSKKLEVYQDCCADILAEAFLSQGNQKEPKPKKNLSSANMLVKTVSGIFKDAGVSPLFIAAEAKRLYKEQADIDIHIPLLTDATMPKLYDCTEMAKELGIFSSSGKPHNQAVSAIISKLNIAESDIVTTAFSRNGHDDVTVQYKPAVFKAVKVWLDENNYPTKITYVDSKGNQKTYSVVYQEVA